MCSLTPYADGAAEIFSCVFSFPYYLWSLLQVLLTGFFGGISLFSFNLSGRVYESFSYIIVSCSVYFFFSLSISLSLPGKASRKNQKWRGPDENIRANLRQYGLEKYYLDALVADFSRPIWRKGMLFDAIITDRKFFTAFCCPITVTKTLLPIYVD